MKTTLTSENPAHIKVINQTDADLIIKNIQKELQAWRLKNLLYHLLVGVLGTVAILGSVIVSVYLDTRSAVLTADRLKLIAIASTVSLSILSAFNIISKTNNYIAACDLMQVALFKYNAKLISLGTLIEAYDKANKIIGGIDFNFDKNFTGAPGKTVVSVDTADEQPTNDEEAKAPDKASQNPATEPAAFPKALTPPVKNKAPEISNQPTTGKPAPPNTGSGASTAAANLVTSETIIDTNNVSVLVSEK
ncbi:hypothetical protein AAE02nite_46800 [Adhaeribacter aerolatus]|uniref:SMODS and SLOG-associating 2TM effector domain-containing protein n=1 Tax=Adhaeribacter aerolatus TaxID=670289 RepID=A0A512B4X0_9BACT|nr:hypothetical protein [Adhaeribacter aerolatus]GEO07016.1 hypothetical protein AAE02nite_46800 [Adhaeribacter aerolatus]